MITIHDVAAYFQKIGWAVEKIGSDNVVIRGSDDNWYQIKLGDNKLSLFALGVADEELSGEASRMLREALVDILADNLLNTNGGLESLEDKMSLPPILKAMSFLNGRDGFTTKGFDFDVIRLVHTDSGIEYEVRAYLDGFKVRVSSWSDSDWSDVCTIEDVTDTIVSMLIDDVSVLDSDFDWNSLSHDKTEVLNDLHNRLSSAVAFE